MGQNPMDMVIGAEGVARDSAACAKHLAAGLEAERQGQRERAIAELRRAVASDARNNDALFHLAYLLDISGEEEEALATYERLCETQPAPVNGLLNLAVLYEDQGDYARAERCVRQVLETNPTHWRAQLFMKDIKASREAVVEEEPDRDLMKRNALLDTPVTDFELSVRARTCLKKMNIRTLGDLLKITEAELMSYKNFGDSSLLEIKKMLATKGLRLGQRREDVHRVARKQIMDQLKGSGREQMLNTSVNDLQLSVRARKALQLLNIMTLGDLASHTEAELMGVKNFGATSLTEITAKLTEYGLSLRALDPSEVPPASA